MAEAHVILAYDPDWFKPNGSRVGTAKTSNVRARNTRGSASDVEAEEVPVVEKRHEPSLQEHERGEAPRAAVGSTREH